MKPVEITNATNDCQNTMVRHYLISGRVQGVGFRRFTENRAKTLQLRGWVRNLGDGRVEAIAEGPESVLNEFELNIRKGPPAAQVTDVKIRQVQADSMGPFETIKDGVKTWNES